jgi:uncharacterized protein (TIGR00369 family)
MADIPEGFEPSPPTGEFGILVGNFYTGTGPGYVTAFRVEERHCNRARSLHGAMLSTLFDAAFYHAARREYEASIGLVTSHLAVDFIGRAGVGDWVEARIEVVRTTRNIGFFTGVAWNGDKRIASATAHFLTVDRTRWPLVS